MSRTIRQGALWLAALAAWSCGPTVSEEELARRVAEIRPTWESYSEDIKAQLGAGPAAEWSGTLQEVRVESNRVLATFVLRGPWAQRQVAAPVLINEPVGGVHANISAERKGDRVTYEFKVVNDEATPLVPWIEFKFPGGQRRIALSDEGSWTAS